jgi:ABC-type glycerol-3-phosphate transport system substrate-binding protein
MNVKSLTVAFVAALFLAACGGGGGSSSSADAGSSDISIPDRIEMVDAK